MPAPIRRVLIANRGAIATRIQRTLGRLGVASVAVYAEADHASRHVAQASAAVSLGEGGASSTYLDMEKVLAAARETGADAIHPGYGFLSENAAFSRAVEAAGMVFLGPTGAQIEAFGLKHEARRLALEADVPMLPGTAVLDSLEEALREADRIGYPVMLKSSAGGGGIGMRIIDSSDALSDAWESVAGLAASSFGDARLFLERFVRAARHVEVQVFGDGAGRVVLLGDRDCSLQRRNQKIIEEAPAPALPDGVRATMHEAARRLMKRVNYRSAGTVEFLYDPEREGVYFLEVNARLQVEHGVTELVTGVDIVEWMLRLGNGESTFLREPPVDGWAMQARLYAEDPARDFRPAPGLVTGLALPETAGDLRVDDWLDVGTVVPASFDPMIAKILAFGADRESARARLGSALQETQVAGVETNVPFLRVALELPDFVAATHHTGSVGGVRPESITAEIVSAGTQTSVQDVEGRLGYWHVGVPPSGAFDYRSLAYGNALLGNDRNAAGLEMLAQGPTLRFTAAVTAVVTGASALVQIDDREIDARAPFDVPAGALLKIDRIAADGAGLRAYLAVAGGLAVPEVLGSRSTFDLGAFGGHAGRALRTGDVIPIGPPPTTPGNPATAPAPDLEDRTRLRVVQGPLLAPDFLDAEYLDIFYATEWKVHYNSARTGIRLEGPAPGWTRTDGGDAGLHPSNVHDNAYAFGAIDFTGDMPIVLGPDGPSLGGFVCPAAIAAADRWKLGQLRPGDTVHFEPIDLDTSRALSAPAAPALVTERKSWRESDGEVVLARDSARDVVLRAAGDSFLLLEIGPPVLELRARLRVEALQRWLEGVGDRDVLELTPGVRSLQFRVPPSADRDRLLKLIQDGLDAIDGQKDITISNRIVHLPLAWDDPATQEATERYMRSVRPDAPWCPRNIEFIRRANGLADEAAVKRIVYDASYLVLGLGDVYLGAPVATPVDPRHRLVTTKYNPARTWTPENAVGIGGAYLCVYGMEGPGGYQFVGRTVQVWNRWRRGGVWEKPWLLRGFDELRFFEVSNEELMDMRREFPLGRLPLKIEDTTFSLAEHEAFLAQEAQSIAAFRARQQAAFAAERARWDEADQNATTRAQTAHAEAVDENETGTAVESPVAGSVWKVLAQSGAEVAAGDAVLVIESMKTEIEVQAPIAGTVTRVLALEGTPVDAGQAVALIEAA